MSAMVHRVKLTEITPLATVDRKTVVTVSRDVQADFHGIMANRISTIRLLLSEPLTCAGLWLTSRVGAGTHSGTSPNDT